MTMRIALVLPLAGALALAACNRSSDVVPVEENLAEAPAEVAPEANIVAPPANITNAVAPAAPPPDFSDEEQVLDDADATGLTARLPQSDEELPGAAGNETRPAE